MNRNRILVILGAVLVLIALAAVRHKRVVEKDQAPLLPRATTVVEVEAVRLGPLESVDHVLGEVRGGEDAEIASRLSGEVREVLVREGDQVARGAILARLDSQELDEALAAAEAEVEATRVAHAAQSASTSRDSVLFVNDAISTEEWEHSQAARAAASARFEVAQHHRDQAQARLGYALARAPFDGVVSGRMVDPGDMAVPGRPILRMVRQSSVRVRGEIPPALLDAVHQGTPVDLVLGDQQERAVVSRVFPSMQGTRLVTFEVDLSNPAPGFVAGATVGVDLHLRSGEGLLVPLDALLEGTEGAHVFVVDQAADGTHTLRVAAVTVNTRSLDEAIVEGDLREGDDVVVARPSRLMTLSAGMEVSTVDASPGR